MMKLAILTSILLLALHAPAAVITDERFRTLDAVEPVCEAGTVVFLSPEDGMILGGPGSSGEEAAITFRKKFELNAFTLLVENLRWSHNAPRGGHPTEFRLLDGNHRGYKLEIRNGSMALYRQDGPENSTELGRLDRLWDAGTEYTTPRTFVLTRNPDGEFEAAFDGIDRKLHARDTRYGKLQSLSIAYKVYLHGYSVSPGTVLLRNDAAPLPLPVPEGDGKLGIIDPEGLLHMARRSNWSAIAAGKLRDSGIPVRLIRGGEAAGKLDGLDTLLLPGFAIDERDLGPVLDFLRSGKTLITAGALDWKAATSEGKQNLHRFCERILGVQAIPPVKSGLLPEVGNCGALRSFDGKKFDRLQLLPIDNSIEKQTLPDGVERINLATAKYEGRNWISQPDRFTGAVAQQTIHHSGEFAGSRVFFFGLPLDSSDPAFVEVIAAAVREQSPVSVTPAPRLEPVPEVTRSNFFEYPGAVLGALCFADYSYLDDPIFVEDANLSGISVVSYCIPWLLEEKDGEVIDWKRLDQIVEKIGGMNKKLMLDPFAFNFNWKAFSWRPADVPYHPEFQRRYIDAMRKIAERYRDNPVLVAMWASSTTHDSDFRVDRSPAIRKLWADYLKDERNFTLEELSRRYECPVTSWDNLPMPEENPELPYNIGPLWNDYFAFHVHAYGNYLRRSIEAVRSVIPEMPLTVRGPFIDAALNMSIAAEFPRVATHIECIESSINTEGFYRSYALGFGVPITAENGWPKASAAATRMALADYLMGNYAALTYSFAGPRWARESFPQFRQVVAVKQEMAGAKYPETELGLLLPDATLYASRPPNLFSIEKLPSLELTLERMNYPFSGVSSAFPRIGGNLKVLLDSGSNRVFSPELKRELAGWIRSGGVFLMFPHSGAYSLDNSGSFSGALGIPAEAGEYAVGKGKVIILAKVDPEDTAGLDRNFTALGLKKPVSIDVPVCNTFLKKGQTGYLVLFDKQKSLVGSFFRESGHATAVAALTPKELTVTPEPGCRKVSDAITGEELKLHGGKVRITLPPAQFRVLKFE